MLPPGTRFSKWLIASFLSLISSTDKAEVEVDGKYDDEEEGSVEGSVGNSDSTKSFSISVESLSLRAWGPWGWGPDKIGVPVPASAFLAALLILPL